MIAAAYNAGGAPSARARLEQLFNAESEPIAGTAATSHVVLGWSASELVTVLESKEPVIAVALGSPGAASEVCPTDVALRLRDPCALFVAKGSDLLLARGPFGGRPVYFSLLDKGRQIIACTRLRPIALQVGGFDFDLDGIVPIVAGYPGRVADRTCYRGVRRLVGCEVIRFSSGNERRTVELPRPPLERKGSIPDLALEFRELLIRSIARSARYLSSASVMTGGGMDSSGILAVAEHARRMGRHDCLFGVVAVDVEGPGDDRPHLKALCKTVGVEPRRIRPESAVPLIPSCFVSDAAPVDWPTAPAEIVAIRTAAAAGAQAVYTGDGGDWVTGGDLNCLSKTTERNGLVRAICLAAMLQTVWPSTAAGRVIDLVLKPAALRIAPKSFVARRRANRLRRSRAWSWAGPRLREFLVSSEPEPRGEDWYSWFARSPDLVSIADARGQRERATGLVERTPYLDAEPVEFMASIPPEARFADHDERGLFREAMRGLLPDSLRMRTDKAFFDPMFSQLGSLAHARGALADILQMEALGDAGVVRPAEFRKVVGEALSRGDGQAWSDAWPALSVEAFLQRGASRQPLATEAA